MQFLHWTATHAEQTSEDYGLVYVQSPLPEVAAMIADNVCVLALRENGNLLLYDIEVFAYMCEKRTTT